ncbi:MAG TPA: CHAT domain-containing protein [Micromonosporaceae bacterium]|nr:CHAT domain-containing protein [Micromonosporaceae bacterium]
MGLPSALVALARHWDRLPATFPDRWAALRPRCLELLTRLAHATTDAERARLARQLILLLRDDPVLAEAIRAALVTGDGQRAWPAPAGDPAGVEPGWGSAVSALWSSATHSRYVNLSVSDATGRRLPRGSDLTPTGRYALRLDIGARSPDSVVTPAQDAPFPEPDLPATAEGTWLDCVATSDDFDVDFVPRRMFLPRAGPSWVCDCPPGTPHACPPADRRPALEVPVTAPAAPGPARLRVVIYHQRNVLQSLLLHAQVGAGHGPRRGHHATVDYSLAGRLDAVGTLPSRELSLLLDAAEAGGPRLVINGAPEELAAVPFSQAQVSAHLAAARAALRDIHIDQVGSSVRNRYDRDNAKTPAALVTDLTALAGLGWQLYTALLRSDLVLARRLRQRLSAGSATIQVAAMGGGLAFPWALVYDIPQDSAGGSHPCQLLAGWVASGTPAGLGADRCPYSAQHRNGTVCPYGFWGFAHTIEQPPAMPAGRELPLAIVPSGPSELVVGVSLDLDRALTEAHLRSLASNAGPASVVTCRSRDEIRRALRDDDLEIVYFYCHGLYESVAAGRKPALGVGRRERLLPDDLLSWALDTAEGWAPEHWAVTTPLVVINGCHTAEVSPETLVNFVETFVGLQAAGVIGTEIAVHQQVAGEVAVELLTALGAGLTVGQAIRQMRHRLLGKGNVLGLAYSAYCSASLHIARAAR